METPFSHLRLTGCNLRGHVISSLQLHYTWTIEDTSYFFSFILTVNKEKQRKGELLLVRFASAYQNQRTRSSDHLFLFPECCVQLLFCSKVVFFSSTPTREVTDFRRWNWNKNLFFFFFFFQRHFDEKEAVETLQVKCRVNSLHRQIAASARTRSHLAHCLADIHKYMFSHITSLHAVLQMCLSWLIRSLWDVEALRLHSSGCAALNSM